MSYRGLWSRELGRAIEGPATPGFVGFVRWLFEPIRPATPLPAPTGEEAREILAALDELEAQRGVPKKHPISSDAASDLDAEDEAQIKVLIAVLEALRTDLRLSAREAFDWIAEQPLSNFGGQTPLQLIEQGRGATVLYYIRSITNGFQG